MNISSYLSLVTIMQPFYIRFL